MACTAPVGDVLDTLSEIGIDRSHLVGASFGAGLAPGVALIGPNWWLPCCSGAPGGSLIAKATADLHRPPASVHPGERAVWTEEDRVRLVLVGICTRHGAY